MLTPGEIWPHNVLINESLQFEFQMGCSVDRAKCSVEIKLAECTSLLNLLQLPSSDCNFWESREFWTFDDKLKQWAQFSFEQNCCSGLHPLDADVDLKNVFISCLMNALVSETNIFGLLFCYVSHHCLVLVLFGWALIKNTNEVTRHVAGVFLHILEELIYVIYVWLCRQLC